MQTRMQHFFPIQNMYQIQNLFGYVCVCVGVFCVCVCVCGVCVCVYVCIWLTCEFSFSRLNC